MDLDEFSKFTEIDLIDESLIIENFDEVKAIVEAAYLKDEQAVKINYNSSEYYKKLIHWSKNLSNLASDEDVYWFTSDYDDYGVYKGKLDRVLSKIYSLFELGVGEVTIINRNLDTFISFDTYVYDGKYFNEIQFFGRYEKLFKKVVIET